MKEHTKIDTHLSDQMCKIMNTRVYCSTKTFEIFPVHVTCVYNH